MGFFKDTEEAIEKMEAAQFKRTLDSTELFSRDGVFYLGKWSKWRKAEQPEAARLLAEFQGQTAPQPGAHENPSHLNDLK